MQTPDGHGHPIDVAHFEQVLQQLRGELDQPGEPTPADEQAVNELLGLDEEEKSAEQSLW